MNRTPKEILRSIVTATLGLIVFAFGNYLTIQANIGTRPWDVFAIGLSKKFGVLYGTASVAIALTIVVIDFLMKEKVGIGMLLDAVIIGKAIDVFNHFNLVPARQSTVGGIICLILGIVVLSFAYFFYMRAGLGCGPRDALLVGLSRKFKKVPIGAVSITLMGSVTLIGWLLGGPVGLGTILCVLLEGPIMQAVFKLLHFDATAVKHQDIFTSLRVLFGKGTAS